MTGRRRLLVAGTLGVLLVVASSARAAGGQPAGDTTPAPGDLGAAAAPTPTQQRVVAADNGPAAAAVVVLIALCAGLGGVTASLARGRRRGPGRRRRKAAVAGPAAAAAALEGEPRRSGELSRPAKSRPAAARAADVPRVPEVTAASLRPARLPAKPAAVAPPAPAKPAAARPTGPSKPAAADAPAPAVVSAGAARDRAEWEVCRVGVWDGYLKKQFYAEAPGGTWLAQSRFFRLERGRSLEDSERAQAARAELLDELARAGWQVTAHRPGSLELALRRPARAAPPAPRPGS